MKYKPLKIKMKRLNEFCMLLNGTKWLEEINAIMRVKNATFRGKITQLADTSISLTHTPRPIRIKTSYKKTDLVFDEDKLYVTVVKWTRTKAKQGGFLFERA